MRLTWIDDIQYTSAIKYKDKISFLMIDVANVHRDNSEQYRTHTLRIRRANWNDERQIFLKAFIKAFIKIRFIEIFMESITRKSASEH